MSINLVGYSLAIQLFSYSDLVSIRLLLVVLLVALEDLSVSSRLWLRRWRMGNGELDGFVSARGRLW